MDFITNQLKLNVPKKCCFQSWKGSNIWTLLYAKACDRTKRKTNAKVSKSNSKYIHIQKHKYHKIIFILNKSSRKVPGKYQESTGKVPGKYLGNARGVSGEYQESTLKILWKYQKRILKDWEVFNIFLYTSALQFSDKTSTAPRQTF